MAPFSNPARARASKLRQAEELYPYYAGFSDRFALDALDWALDGKLGLVLDPWNGAGTTTRLAQSLEVGAIGVDLNPVMVLVAKANLFSGIDAPVLIPLSEKLIEYAASSPRTEDSNPLSALFKPTTANMFRALAKSIWVHLVNAQDGDNKTVDAISPLPSIFYVGLFNAIRGFLRPLSTSNPTWLKLPKSNGETISVRSSEIIESFRKEMARLAGVTKNLPGRERAILTTCLLGDSSNLSIPNASIDAVLTSPPYCTRLDYARATMPELLCLESVGLADYSVTRGKLMGAVATAPILAEGVPVAWGDRCAEFMEKVYQHPSKASKTYYYRYHFCYFDSLFRSLAELGRVVKGGGRVCLVAQDSYYKDVHNDLPILIREMASSCGFNFMGEFKYVKKNPISSINARSAAYREYRRPCETAVLFQRS